MSQIVFNNISKIYGTTKTNIVKALDDVSFQIEEGEFVIILGASGAGKSTILNILGGMDNASGGDYFVNGENITKLSEKALGKFRRNEIGFVFQFYNLMPNLTALENVTLASSVAPKGLNAFEIFESVGLLGHEKQFPSQLSGGEQQRVAIARAIVKNPTLLLCDEPTGALDSKTGAMIIKLLKDISNKYHKTVIIVTHNSKIAEVGNRLIRVQDGKIILDKTIANPKSVEEIEW